MKWGGDFKITTWDSLLKALLVIIAVIIIVGMLVDFVSWRDALNLVRQKIPISGTAYTWIKGYYVPFVWRSGPLHGELILQPTPDWNLSHPIRGAITFDYQRDKGFWKVYIEDSSGSLTVDRNPEDLNFREFHIFVLPVDSSFSNIKYAYTSQTYTWSGKCKLLLVYDFDGREYFKFINSAWLNCQGWHWSF